MEPFSLIKLISGFNIFDGSKLGKIVFYLTLITLALGAYHRLFVQRTIDKMQQTSIQNVGHLTFTQNHDPRKEIFLGVRVRRLKLGISYE